jgi:hypothetical protein
VGPGGGVPAPPESFMPRRMSPQALPLVPPHERSRETPLQVDDVVSCKSRLQDEDKVTLVIQKQAASD